MVLSQLHKGTAKISSIKNQISVNLTTKSDKNAHFLKYAGSPGFFRPANIGDALSTYIYEYITDNKAPARLEMSNSRQLSNYMIVGSILQFADQKTIVWGAGFNSEKSNFGCVNWQQAASTDSKKTREVHPNRIHAVRGPLTRKRVLDLGVDCPNVLGDPAIIMPLLYQPKKKNKTISLGIIPHFYHHNSPCFDNLLYEKDTKIISVYQTPENFIDELVKCEYIISSSLHGLILADAYNIPSLWVCPSDGLQASVFKYLDYLESVNSSIKERIIIDSTTKLKDIILMLTSIEKQKIDVQPLLKSCPFINKNKLHELIKLSRNI